MNAGSLAVQQVLDELRGGETSHVEFKSTLTWNIRARKKDEIIIHSAMRAIAGYLNADGGVLYLGVTPDGEAYGLEADGYTDDDQFQRLIGGYVRRYLGNVAATLIRYEFFDIDRTRICRVSCRQSPSPIFLRQGKDEEFYVRVGTEVSRFSLSEAHDYCSTHFASANQKVRPATIELLKAQVYFRERDITIVGGRTSRRLEGYPVSRERVEHRISLGSSLGLRLVVYIATTGNGELVFPRHKISTRVKAPDGRGISFDELKIDDSGSMDIRVTSAQRFTIVGSFRVPTDPFNEPRQQELKLLLDLGHMVSGVTTVRETLRWAAAKELYEFPVPPEV